MERLPNEILGYCMSYLDMKSLLNARLCSKKINASAERFGHYRIALDHEVSLQKRKYVCTRRIVHLKLNCSSMDRCSQMPRFPQLVRFLSLKYRCSVSIVKDALHRYTNINYLEFDNMLEEYLLFKDPAFQWSSVVKALNNLTSLHLCSSFYAQSQRLFDEISIIKIPNLRDFKFGQIVETRTLAQFRHFVNMHSDSLVRLEIVCEGDQFRHTISLQDLNAPLGNFLKLKQLHVKCKLTRCSNQYEPLHGFWARFVELPLSFEVLNVDRAIISISRISPILEKCSNTIQELKLDSLGKYDDLSTIPLINKCCNIRKLNLKFLPIFRCGIQNPDSNPYFAIPHDLQFPPTLTELHLKKCIIERSQFISSIESLPTLRILKLVNLGYCTDSMYGIDHNVFIDLLRKCNLTCLILGGVVRTGLGNTAADKECWNNIVSEAAALGICRPSLSGQHILYSAKFRFEWNVTSEKRKAFLNVLDAIKMNHVFLCGNSTELSTI